MPYSNNSLSMYQSRYNSLCILKYVSIQIQLSVFLSMYQSRSLSILKYESIQIQLSVFLSMYQSRYNSLYSLVCINPDTSLCILKYVLIQIQLAQTLSSLPRTISSDLNQLQFIFNSLYFEYKVQIRLKLTDNTVWL